MGTAPPPIPMAGSPLVFLDHSGHPLRVFVETTEFAFRPKLMRSLRKGGASIAHFPPEAQIILVDLDTDAGKEFATVWGSDPGKVVLDWRWARVSVERGRAFLANENWGGYRIVNDNQHRSINANIEDENPLPTPRQTPPEIGPFAQVPNMPSIPTIQPPVLNTPTAIPHPQEVRMGDTSHLQNFGTPISQISPLQALPLTPANGVAFSSQTYGNTFSQSPAPTQPQATLVNMVMEALRQPGINFGDPATFPAQLLQQLLVQSSLLGSLNQIPPSQQQQPSQVSSTPQADPFTGLAASDFMNGSPSTNVPLETHHHHNHPPSFSYHRSPSSTPAPQILPSSLKRKDSPTLISPSMSSRRKGKARNTYQERPTRVARTSTSPHSEGGVWSTPPSQRRSSGHSSQDVEVFKTNKGESMSFYVQIETRNRGDLVHVIRKSGGKIVSDIPQADIVILAPHSKPYGDWLRRADLADKRPLQASYVYDCIRDLSLLEVESYELKVPSEQRKRGRQPKSPHREVKSEAKNVKSKKAAKPSPKSAASPVQKSEVVDSVLPESSERSPSPPQKATYWQDGKNLYSAEEREYVNRYLGVLLSRDPDISLSAIAQKMHKKMPQHSIMSWRSFISKVGSDIDRLRKKAFIAQRKTAVTSVQQELQTDIRPSPPAFSSQDVPPDGGPPEHAAAHSHEGNGSTQDDFRAITEFLAAGGADNRSDEEVWAALANRHPSRSAAQWQELWSEQGHAINAEVRGLMDAQATYVGHTEGISAESTLDEPWIDTKTEQ